jgi:hypothetical protein
VHLLSMGNRAHIQRRRGNGRPGPLDREREDAAVELRSEQGTETVRRHRAKLKEIIENARVDPNVEVNQFVQSKCHFVIKRLIESIEPHLSRCPSPGGQQAIFERFLRHRSISPHLPSYYLPPKETATQKLLVEDLRSDLD